MAARESDDDDNKDDEENSEDGHGALAMGQSHWSFAVAKSWPDIRYYYRAIMEVTSKRASALGSVFEASLGISAAFGLRSPGRFVCGLPDTSLGESLRLAAQNPHPKTTTNHLSPPAKLWNGSNKRVARYEGHLRYRLKYK